MIRFLILPAAALLAATSAGAATLKIGDPAPALQVSQWVQGEPVQGFDNQHVYIVEFWATWCGPCKASIPHLNEIWEKYKDKQLVVIGQDCWEKDETKVPDFVTKTMSGKMTYRVALDNKTQETNGAMAITWMKAADQNGIPTAFVINRQGKIAWMGHPMSLKESVLDDILADKFDVAAYAAEFEKDKQEKEQRQKASQSLVKAMQSKDWDAADKALDDLEKVWPEIQPQGNAIRLSIVLGRKDFSGAYKLAETASNEAATNAGVLRILASTLAAAEGLDAQGLALAGKIAERADQVSHGTNYMVLDTLARVRFLNGQTNEAVATQQKALGLAPDFAKASLERSLTNYQAGRLPDSKQ
jgi:thiol-disulfide isomerase/thioredoxin